MFILFAFKLFFWFVYTSFICTTATAGTVRFTKDHEYIKLESAKIGIVGITDFAQKELGDVVYVELPAVVR
jgi:glycine cleavage system H lipoate-binding protein